MQPGAADSRCLFSASAPGANTVSVHSFHPRPPAPPNPSLKRRTNGVARWPSSAGPSAHFALAVQHATPLVPA